MGRIEVPPKDLETIRKILDLHVPGIEVRAFGSRVAGNARRHSDLDLILMTDEALEIGILARLNAALSDSSLPFAVDVLDWASLEESFRDLVSKGSVVIRDRKHR
jgi:type I restriction enzyme S subunit